MSFFYAVFIYVLIWWVMLFTVLPMGVQQHGYNDDGIEAGAPKNANLKKKLILNTIISFAILLVIHILVKTGVIDWWHWFEPK